VIKDGSGSGVEDEDLGGDQGRAPAAPRLRVAGGLDVDYDRSFADEPLSFTERRAAAACDGGDARMLSPREALVAMLRDIDSGEIEPEQVVLTYYRNTPAGFDVGFYAGGPHVATFQAGVLERVKMLLLAGV
jgi:hypothetical protein